MASTDGSEGGRRKVGAKKNQSVPDDALNQSVMKDLERLNVGLN